MCGIAGFISTTLPVDPELLQTARDTLRHRGPDDSGIWISGDRRVGLAHRRLSIIDLSPRGHQPMADRSGKVHITFNGEIYNFIELREELERLGHSFNSASDTEVVIEAYREWGRDSLVHLNGMFAMALYDADQQTLLCARDRAGEKPFFYRHEGGTFAFASELKALLADPGAPRDLDREGLEEFLAYGFVSAERTILHGYRKLRPGHALAYHLPSASLTEWSYWSLPAPPDAAKSLDDLTDELEELLAAAVKAQLVADVPVGVLLSGGIDSSLVTAMAARARSAVRTFTISFPDHPEYDEGRYARAVASHFRTDHTELPAESASVEVLPLLARQYDEPIGDSSIVPTYLVSKLIREHATVALGGDGGDELFGGYPHYSALQRAATAHSELIAAARRRLASTVGRMIPVGVRGRNRLMTTAADFDLNLVQPRAFFDEWNRSRLLSPNAKQAVRSPEATRLGVCREGSHLRRLMETDFRTTMPDLYLVKVDRASMLNSLEVRSPWLDHRLIEFAFGIVPNALKATPRARKIVSRQLARRLLPATLDLTRKQGFSIPLQAWFRDGWGSYMASVLLDADPRLFERRYIRSLLLGQSRGRSNTARLFALTMFELWRREYDIRIPW